MDGISKFFGGFQAAATGLAAERARVDVIARNIANAETTSTPEGGPYRRQVLRFAPILERTANGKVQTQGVQVVGVEQDNNTPFEHRHSLPPFFLRLRPRCGPAQAGSAERALRSIRSRHTRKCRRP